MIATEVEIEIGYYEGNPCVILNVYGIDHDIKTEREEAKVIMLMEDASRVIEGIGMSIINFQSRDN